jgi:hypothetical protein
MVNGEAVEIEIGSIASPAARVAPERRTTGEVAEIRVAARQLLSSVAAKMPTGAALQLEVIDTATGASVRGVVTDPGGSPVDVSVERLVVLETDDIALLVAADSSAVDAAGVMSVQSGTRLGFAGGGLASQEALQVYVMSTPTLVAETLTSSDGTFVLSDSLPAALPPGDHTLVVATGDVQLSMGIQILEVDVANESALPTAGGTDDLAAWALLIFALGLLVRMRVGLRESD